MIILENNPKKCMTEGMWYKTKLKLAIIDRRKKGLMAFTHQYD